MKTPNFISAALVALSLPAGAQPMADTSSLTARLGVGRDILALQWDRTELVAAFTVK